MHHYLYQVLDGGIPILQIGPRNILLTDKEFSVTLTISLDELEEVGVRRFLIEAPRALLTQFEAQLGAEIAIRREGLAWAHLHFANRLGMQCVFHGLDGNLALTAFLSLAIGITPMPPEFSGMVLVMGPTPSFPFMVREMGELPPDEVLSEQLTAEGLRGLALLVQECFHLGMPPEGVQ